jgi:hypothetical protein
MLTNLAPEEKSEITYQTELSKLTPSKAYLLTFSDGRWSATILDSALDSFTQDGFGNTQIAFECVPGIMNVYSLSVQKGLGGHLLLVVVQNGKLMDAVNTQAAYGIASLAGKCGQPENIDLNDLQTPTQAQRELKEAEQRAYEVEAAKAKELQEQIDESCLSNDVYGTYDPYCRSVRESHQENQSRQGC